MSWQWVGGGPPAPTPAARPISAAAAAFAAAVAFAAQQTFGGGGAFVGQQAFGGGGAPVSEQPHITINLPGFHQFPPPPPQGIAAVTQWHPPPPPPPPGGAVINIGQPAFPEAPWWQLQAQAVQLAAAQAAQVLQPVPGPDPNVVPGHAANSSGGPFVPGHAGSGPPVPFKALPFRRPTTHMPRGSAGAAASWASAPAAGPAPPHTAAAAAASADAAASGPSASSSAAAAAASSAPGPAADVGVAAWAGEMGLRMCRFCGEQAWLRKGACANQQCARVLSLCCALKQFIFCMKTCFAFVFL